MDDLPYKCEYAKTGRAGCKGCKTNIGQGTLRIAAMVQSAFHDGKQPNWFHEQCFFKKQRPGSEGDIGNFENMKYDDQERIRKTIAELGSVVTSTGGKGKKRSKDENSALKDYGVEYSKSSRAACRGCEQKIVKDDIRVRKTVYDTEVGMKYGGQALWHHVECFAKVRGELGWLEAGDKLPGFKSLSKEDQDKTKNTLPAIKSEDVPDAKKLKLEPKDETDLTEEKNLKAKIKKQTEKFHKFRDAIIAEMKKTEMLELLEVNNQKPLNHDSNKLYDQLADMLTFGALSECTNCKGGQFVFNKSGFICIGELTEWTKCVNLVQTPLRKPCVIPSELKQKYSFLAKVSKKTEDRAILYVPPSVSNTMKMLKKEEELSGPKVKRERPPLYNLTFVFIGIGKEVENDLKKTIVQLGGKCDKKVDATTFAVVSNEKEVGKMSSRMLKARELGIHVVPLDYFDAVKDDAAGVVNYVISKSICDWGTDPNARIPVEETKSSKSKSIYTKSVPKSMKLKLKDGLAVDPDSGLEDVAHVYCEGKIKYNSVLGLTDVQRNKNSFYKLQILESDKKNRYWLFRSWGRIGTIIGGSKVEDCNTIVDAKQKFESLYLEKSGNSWGDSNFTKRPGCMYPIDIDYSDDKNVNFFENKNSLKSHLDVPLQELIQLIFDVDSMKKCMLEFDLDMEKMPLGKLSKSQIQQAYKVLTEVVDLIQKGGTNSQFIDATNRFYTLIPHNFGVDNPPLLDTNEQITNLTAMLDSLLEIECAFSMLQEDKQEDDGDIHPIDQHYKKLKTKLEPIDKKSAEFKLLKKYVKNTHAETHKMYDLEIIDIFRVERQGECRRFKPFRKLHNRKLLWHGSRLTNYAGILSHGLKIAPPEAPVTGYMFGKGVYFADMVSKSANYCCTSQTNSTGLMLLSEVALGDMMECTNAQYVTQLPKDKHSTFGKGRTQPDPKESVIREDGVEIPLGKPKTDDKLVTSLLYNEYIVYDVAQINIKYLFKMNFNYKY